MDNEIANTDRESAGHYTEINSVYGVEVNDAIFYFTAVRKRPSAIERKIFAEHLRLLRRERGISQEMLAEMADLHRTFVGVVERSETNISIDNMSKIACALDCDLYKLLVPHKAGTNKK